MSHLEHHPALDRSTAPKFLDLAARVTEVRLNTRDILATYDRRDGTPDVDRIESVLREIFKGVHGELETAAAGVAEPIKLLRYGTLYDDVAEYASAKAKKIDSIELVRQAEHFSVSAAACYRTAWELAMDAGSGNTESQAAVATHAMASELFSRICAAGAERDLQSVAESPRYVETSPLAAALAGCSREIDQAHQRISESLTDDNAQRHLRHAQAVARAQSLV